MVVIRSCWIFACCPFVFAVVFSSVALFCSACVGLLRLGSLSPCFVPPPALPALSVSPLVPSDPVSVLLVPPSALRFSPSSWPVLLPPSCPCCLSGRPLCPAAAGLRLLSSALFVLWLSLPASLPLCVLVCGLLPLCFGLLLWLLVLFLSGVFGLLLPFCCWICGLYLLPAY